MTSKNSNKRQLIITLPIYSHSSDSNFSKFDETVRLALTADDLMNAPPGEMNVLQAAANYGLERYVRCLLEYPGIKNRFSSLSVNSYWAKIIDLVSLSYHAICLLGIDPNKASKGTLPSLLRAALDGEFKVIQALLDHKVK